MNTQEALRTLAADGTNLFEKPMQNGENAAVRIMEDICRDIVSELLRQHLTDSTETFLSEQAQIVAKRAEYGA